MTDYRQGGSGNPVAYLDVITNAMITFAVMAALLFVLVTKLAKENSNEKKPGYSEGVYRITSIWGAKLADDVDLYVQDPAGNIVYFNNREAGLMHLEHDDLGRRNDVMNTDSSEIVLEENIEHVILRGTAAGEYIVNVHMFRMMSHEPVAVTVRLSKSAGDETVTERTVLLSRNGDEATAFRFTLDGKAAVAETNQMEKSLVGSRESTASQYLDGGE